MRRREGFTLVEMLVALAVFGLIAAAAASVLAYAADSRDAVRGRADRLGELARLRATLKADLGQAAPRLTRDETGRRVDAAFEGGGEALFVLVRRGRENPSGAARPSLQAVRWRLADGRLERQVRRALDGGAWGEPQVLATGVRAARAEFLLQDGWVPGFTGTLARPLPRAVRLEIEFEREGRLSQLFLVPGGET